MNNFKIDSITFISIYDKTNNYKPSIREIEIMKDLSLEENYIRYDAYNKFSHLEINDSIFNDNQISILKIIKKELIKHIGEYYTIIESGQKVYLDKKLASEYTYSKYSMGLNEYKQIIKGNLIPSLGDLIENATDKKYDKNKKPKHKIDAAYGFYKYLVKFTFSNKKYSCILLIRNDLNGKKYLYDILDIKTID